MEWFWVSFGGSKGLEREKCGFGVVVKGREAMHEAEQPREKRI